MNETYLTDLVQRSSPRNVENRSSSDIVLMTFTIETAREPVQLVIMTQTKIMWLLME
jgi:hypothetical protein